ncbi:polyunsaturated fatty acid 5-lipoxygenase-like [Antedon mediterranea]|uniref:polyunsaturated fatty acid 5-lipoxygenase-like n=1 Tax=Antedon mediterranea TaxID=105859 RepID=UPI003AF72640
MGGKESKQCQYEVVVKTIDQKFAGTDDDILLTLINSNGKKSKAFNLDVQYRDDFEEGQRNTFELTEFHDFGSIEKIEITLKRTVIGAICGRKDYWGLEWILIADKVERKIYEFPVNRWMVSGETKRWARYDTCLPQHDTEIDQRKRELVLMRDTYKFHALFPGVTPLLQNLPFEEKPDGSMIKNLLVENEMAAKLISCTTKPFTSLAEMDSVYKYCYSKPAAFDHWRSDSYFGRLQLTGGNPTRLRLCTKIPEYFGVTDNMVKPSMKDVTLEKAIQEKRLFISDYADLENVSNLHAPICLYYVNDAEDLVPVAIQLRHTKSPTNPVFVPSDPEYTWIIAKLWFGVVDSNYHEICAHLSFTHFILETITIAIHRHLSPSHPLSRLVKPHIEKVLNTNWLGRKLLLDPESGFFEKSFKAGAEDASKLIKHTLSNWSFKKNGMLPNDLKERGLFDPKILPKFYYRDDGLLIWNAIRSYVYRVAENFYDSQEEIENDNELHLFRHTLTKSVESGGCGLKDVPGDDNAGITDLEQIVDIFTTTIFISSAYHAAVNFPTYEQCAFTPNFPLNLRGSIPNNKKPRTELDVIRTLPTKDDTLKIMTLTQALSTFKSSSLGNFDVQYMYNRACVDALKEFRSELKKVAGIIDQRNRLRTVSYTVLHPDNIPNTIAV